MALALLLALASLFPGYPFPFIGFSFLDKMDRLSKMAIFPNLLLIPRFWDMYVLQLEYRLEYYKRHSQLRVKGTVLCYCENEGGFLHCTVACIFAQNDVVVRFSRCNVEFRCSHKYSRLLQSKSRSICKSRQTLCVSSPRPQIVKYAEFLATEISLPSPLATSSPRVADATLRLWLPAVIS